MLFSLWRVFQSREFISSLRVTSRFGATEHQAGFGEIDQ